MKLGASNRPERPIREEFEWIAENGFDFVDVRVEAPHASVEATDWQSVAMLLRDLALDAVCQSAHYLPLDNPSPLVRQSALDEIRRTIDVAHRIGASTCTVGFQGWPGYLSDQEGYTYYQQLLTIAGKHAIERDVKLALCNGSENRHQLKYLREIYHRVEPLAFTFDIGNLNIGTVRSTTRDYLFALGGRLVLVYLSDNSGDNRSRLPFGAPASGGIELESEVRTLHNFGFDGPITVDIAGDRQWLLLSAERLRSVWQHISAG